MSNSFLKAAFALRRAGWLSTVPIRPMTKRPTIAGWEVYGPHPPSDHDVAKWASQFPDASVGYVFGGAVRVIAADLDFIDDATAARAFAVAKRILGPTPLLRVGMEPKKLLLYIYADGPAPPGKAFDGFEVFFKTGQCVFDGVHPTTRRPYSWPIAHPSAVPPSSLPVVASAQVLELIEALRPLPSQKPGSGAPKQQRRTTFSPVGASDRCNGAVAAVLPDLRAAADPPAAAREIVSAATEGNRYPTAFGVIVALVKMGFDDGVIWSAVSPAFAAHFPDPRERADRLDTISSALRWARDAIGPDLSTLRAMPFAQSLLRAVEGGL